MDLRFEACGEGEPLIILHGLLGSLENWRSVSAKLAGSFRVFALDQRNHGHSAHSPKMDYRLMAEDVKQVMETQHLTDAFVLGHSMGGKTAMQLALLHPPTVRKLIVVDIAPRSYPPREEKIIAAMLSLDLSRFHTRKEMETALAPAVPNSSTRQFLLKNVARGPAGDFCWKLGLQEISQNYAHLAEAVTGGEPFEKPALFIRGEKSDFLLESDLEPIRHLFPRAVLETIPAAGHLVHVENTEAFLRAVLGFLRIP